MLWITFNVNGKIPPAGSVCNIWDGDKKRSIHPSFPTTWWTTTCDGAMNVCTMCTPLCAYRGGFLARFTEQSPLIIGKCLHLISSPDWKTNYSAMRLPKAKQEQAGATTSRYLCKWVCPNRSSACLRFAYWCVCMCILYPVPSQMESSDVWAERVFKPNRGSSVALYRAYQKTPEAEADIDRYSSDGARANERVWINSTSN